MAVSTNAVWAFLEQRVALCSASPLQMDTLSNLSSTVVTGTWSCASRACSISNNRFPVVGQGDRTVCMLIGGGTVSVDWTSQSTTMTARSSSVFVMRDGSRPSVGVCWMRSIYLGDSSANRPTTNIAPVWRLIDLIGRGANPAQLLTPSASPWRGRLSRCLKWRQTFLAGVKLCSSFICRQSGLWTLLLLLRLTRDVLTSHRFNDFIERMYCCKSTAFTLSAAQLCLTEKDRFLSTVTVSLAISILWLIQVVNQWWT